MKRPSKLRVLLAVNLWRIRHKRTPILYLPKGTPTSCSGCPLARALGCMVGFTYGHEARLLPLPKVLFDFREAFDARLYPELVA